MKRALAFLTPALVATFSFACTENEPDSPDASVPQSDAGVVPEIPIPKIVAFTASADSVGRGETVELYWKVENAQKVNIFSATEILVSTTELEGTISTLPLKNKSSFEIRAAGNGLVGAAVEVDAIWPAPTISEPIVDPEVFYVNSFTQVRWTAENAVTVSVFANDILVSSYAGNQANGATTFISIFAETTTVRIEADNPTESTTRELVLTAIPMPQINLFRVTPRTYIGTSTVVHVEWATTGFTRTDLLANFSRVEDFSGEASGTTDVEIFTPTYFSLQGFVDNFSSMQEDIAVSPAAAELEPNNSMPGAQLITFEGGVVGNLSSENDVDYYTIEIYPFNGAAGLRVWTRGVTAGCPVDTIVELHATFGGLLGSNEDDGIPTGRAEGAGCSEILPSRDFFASGLYGQYALGVRSQRGESGDYVLFTEIIPSGR
jgi:hypothetical protein